MATKPRTILTPGDSAAPAQPTEQDVMQQRVADTVFTFPEPEPDPAPKAEAPAAPAQPAVQVVSNTPKLTPEGWVVPADFGAQPKRVG